MLSAGTHYLVIVQAKRFLCFRYWCIWDTRDPTYTVTAFNQKAADTAAKSLAYDGGEVANWDGERRLSMVIADHG